MEGLFHNLASRIGAVPEGSVVPGAVRQQLWSPANVPLMWAASGIADSTPALDWLIETADRMSEPIEFNGGRVSARDALRTGWLSLREVFRGWGIGEPDQLTAWLRRQGFAGTAPGNHIAARDQEFILGEASRLDARVSLLEVVYVKLAIHLGRCLTVPQSQHPIREVRANFDWAQLDQFQIEDLFLHPIPMLKSCPHFLRGQFRECFQVALRERFLAKLRGDEAGQVRGWKLFAHDDAAQTIWQWICWKKRVGPQSGSICGRQVGGVGSRCHTTPVRERLTR